MNEKDKQETILRYTKRYKEFGYSEEALGWSRNKNDFRFQHLVSEWQSELNGAEIGDFGCGFGDFYKFLSANPDFKSAIYTGIDINEELITEARKQHPGINFWVGDLSKDKINQQFDFVFSSGVFNHKLSASDEYEFILDSMNAIRKITRKGFAINFLSDKVEYKLEHTFHSNPSKILEMCYGFSNNVILKNDCMPFEFTIFVRLDKKVDASKVIYS